MSVSPSARSCRWHLFIACAVATVAAGAQQPPGLRLPGIIHKWTPGAQTDGPEISIEEIGRCMGVDLSLQTRVADLQKEQETLEQTRTQVEALAPPIQAESTLLAAENLRLDTMSKQVKAASEDLDRRQAAMSAARPKAKATAEEVRRFNADVEVYNADAAAHNKRVAGLKEEMSKLRPRIDSFNAAAAELNTRVDAFNARNNDFQLAAKRFNDEIAGYANRCAGERTLKK